MLLCFFKGYGDHRDLHVLTHSFPTRRSSDLSDQVYEEGLRHGRCFRHGNLFYNGAADGEGDRFTRMVQWPSYHQPLLNSMRLDRRIARLLEPLIGRDLKQIINQVHWKAPGSLGDFA